MLLNPQAPPESNAAKRCVRAVAVLEDVCKFKQSPECMDAFCIFFTLFASAEACGIGRLAKRLEDCERSF